MHLLILSTLFVLVAAPIAWTATSRARRAPKAHPLALELARLINPFDPAVHERIVLSGHPTMRGRRGSAEGQAQAHRGRARRGARRARRTRSRRATRPVRSTPARDSLSQTATSSRRPRKAVRELGEIDDKIAALQKVQVATLRRCSARTPPPPAATATTGRPATPTDPRGWNSAHLRERGHPGACSRSPRDEDAVRRDRARRGRRARRARRRRHRHDEHAPRRLRRDRAAAAPPLRVLDLIPTGTMDNNTFPYTQESGRSRRPRRRGGSRQARGRDHVHRRDRRTRRRSRTG
jgi:hypothetical protein